MFDDDLFLELLIKATFFYKSVKLGRIGSFPMNGTTCRKIMFVMSEENITNIYVCLQQKRLELTYCCNVLKIVRLRHDYPSPSP